MYRRSHRTTRGLELPRLLTMIVLLGVVGMMMVRARDPGMWRWLAPEESQAASAITQGRSDGTQTLAFAAGASESAARALQAEAPAEPAAAGPVDDDPEQREAALEEFQAVTDGAIGIAPEEMFAYSRFLSWVQRQPYATLAKRATKDFSFHDLMQSPSKNRGRLLRLDLQVRRVLKLEAKDLPAGVTALYEIWGWSPDSGSWLYTCITPELPAGMPVGANVDERVTFCGYFLKLQGYLEAGASPRAAPLKAPLLIGRMARQSRPEGATARRDLTDSSTVWIVLAGAFVVYVGARTWLVWRKRQARALAAVKPEEQESKVDHWLSDVERDPVHAPPPGGNNGPPQEGDPDCASDVWPAFRDGRDS